MPLILVIEDDADSREMLCCLLKDYGFTTISADDGFAGLQKARSHRPDLIISDLDIPYVNGIDVLRALRQDPDTASIPYIVCTGSADEDFQNLAFGLGVSGYFIKPVDLFALVHWVNQHLPEVVPNCSTMPSKVF